MHRVLVWRFPEPMMCIASAPHGGGMGLREWACNAEVARDFPYTDLDAHVLDIARAHGCRGDGVGMLTAARVADASHACEDGVDVCATVGVTLTTWAADADGRATSWQAGTVNVFVRLPVLLSPAALVNAVMTATEAKTQALFDASVPGTGTASDAVCIVCPAHGRAEEFGGPRSRVGAPLARAVHRAIRNGLPCSR
jgi:adenosylcobinamide amidohydrolase